MPKLPKFRISDHFQTPRSVREALEMGYGWACTAGACSIAYAATVVVPLLVK